MIRLGFPSALGYVTVTDLLDGLGDGGAARDGGFDAAVMISISASVWS